MNIEENKKEMLDEYVIYTETDLDGKITYASEAFIKISGYSKEELIGKNHNIIRHPDMPSSVFAELWETIKSGKIWKGTVKNLKKDGKYYITKSIIRPLFNENGEPVGYSSVREDISDKVKAEEFQKRLGLLVKETKLKHISVIDEYKNKYAEQEKKNKELLRQIDLLKIDISDLKTSNNFLKTKLDNITQKTSMKEKHFEGIVVDNSTKQNKG
ncbi:MAG: PAS domain-containing protein [Campylobacterota bacterium]|nr:PAS domain-containing protein [Campylobacterota bacterium]